MRDNLEDIQKKFTVDVDEKYAGGWAYICRNCGKEAHSVEGLLPCQQHFVPLRIWCNECRAKWKLEIEPTEEELAAQSKH